MTALLSFFDDVSGAVHAGSSSLGVGMVIASNDHASNAAYFQLHDTAAADPANAAVPVIAYRVPAATTVTLSFRDANFLRGSFSTGLAFGWSTTRDTFTAYGTATDVSCSIALV